MPKPKKEAGSPKPKPRPARKQEEESYKVIRIAESDLLGNKKVKHALTKIKGISWSFSNAILKVLNLENKTIGELSDEEITKLKDVLENPAKYGIPSWLYNRKKDRIRGQDLHLLSSDLAFVKKMDVESLKKIKCYRGVRHYYNYKVRGQRTRSRGANVKGRVGSTVGVVRKKQQPQKSKKK